MPDDYPEPPGVGSVRRKLCILWRLRKKFGLPCGEGGSDRNDKSKRASTSPFGSLEHPFSKQTADFCEDRNLRIIVLISLGRPWKFEPDQTA
jgi:hypothetical protein